MQKSALKPETVKNNVKRLLEKRNWSQTDLEKKIGTKTNVNNILRGRSQYPTIELLQKIAIAFNIEVTELLKEEDNNRYEPINHQLLTISFNRVMDIIKPIEKQFSITPKNIFSIVNEVYDYSQKLNIDTIDDKFVEWVISKYYS
jgi:transcriptional regulator with XRE-family HTH domain